MYSPKERELEGEVDHSFFDSDCETNGAEDGRLEKKEVSQRPDEREGQETHVLMHQTGTKCQSGGNDRETGRLEDVSHQESSSRHDEETERVGDLIKDGQSRDEAFKGSSPIPSAKNSEVTNNSQSDEGSSVQSSDEDHELDDGDSTVHKHRKNSNSNINGDDDDDDGYHRSDDESEEEDGLPGRRLSKHRGVSHGTPKKKAGKFRNLNRSCSSSSGADSSHSSEEGSSAYSPKSLVKHHRRASASQRERSKESDDSEDTVTDVTPLSTPNVSPAQSIDVVSFPEPLARDVQQRQASLTEETAVGQEGSDDQGSISSEGEDEPVLLKVEKQLDRVLVSSAGSVSSSRKNYSFTNEEVRKIDRENQRLLRELSRSSARSRSSGSTLSSTCGRRSNAAPVHLYHSAINRQKELERIQKENLAFLKRLESVKATPGLTRDEQLTDYQRQCQYLGTHNTAIPLLKPKTSKASGRSSRPCSSPHKSRPETAKLHRTTPRPAWS